MPLNELIQFGLTKTQAEVLAYLLENGEQKVREITRGVKHPRGVVYKTLEELIAMALAEKIEKDKSIAKFRASHPRNLEKLLENQEKDWQTNKSLFLETLPSLISSYNLTLNKPGVKFYEGEDGFKKILYDTLTSQTEIYMVINTEAVAQEKKFKEINEEYKRRREQAGIAKKVIRFGKKPFHEASQGKIYDRLTQFKYIEKTANPFTASIQIYDNKISYQIMDKENIIGILIENKQVYEMHKAFFEAIWDNIKV